MSARCHAVGLDEAPHAYRRLPDVLSTQRGAVEVLHTLRPLIVGWPTRTGPTLRAAGYGLRASGTTYQDNKAMQGQLPGIIRKHEKFAAESIEPRDVHVYLPPGYGTSPTQRFPVLYLHDGQNLFDPTTAFREDWKVDSTAESLIQKGEVEPMIIVGIANSGEKRIDEYTPTKDEARQKGGEAEKYGRMLISELKPFIDRLYRTRPDPANTGLGGSSLGGLITLHLGLRHSSVFGKLAVLSPSVWWDSRKIIHEVVALTSKLPLRIWLDAGTGEGPDVTTDARMLRDALVAKGWKVDDDLKYFEAEGAEHNERAWGSRVDRVLKYLFPKQA